ncbi:MAG: hypothetical protein HFF02_05720 [Erysipelotrichaceae bacterium]|nr:hypothetical protein [Erysipelotrichaceae bacterium]
MKNFEMVGFLLGAILGAIGTGICVYLTRSIFSSLIGLSCTILGGFIERIIKK